MGNLTKSARKSLGQFWTPPAIVNFMLELVECEPLWKVIDPACGEGIFLMGAIKRGCGAIAGVDIDPEALERARKLLGVSSGKVRLYCQDGLDPIQDENAFWRGDYDLVIGNPPFANTGYRISNPAILRRFELAQVRVDTQADKENGQPALFDLPVEYKRQKSSQSIEVLFLERFIQLCKPGGKVCIILPEGIFANSSVHHVREWLVEQFTLLAIVGLPRDTFKRVSTTAKTAILYLEKRPPKASHQVFLAEVSDFKHDSTESLTPQLEEILTQFRRYREGCSPP